MFRVRIKREYSLQNKTVSPLTIDIQDMNCFDWAKNKHKHMDEHKRRHQPQLRNFHPCSLYS